MKSLLFDKFRNGAAAMMCERELLARAGIDPSWELDQDEVDKAIAALWAAAVKAREAGDFNPPLPDLAELAREIAARREEEEPPEAAGRLAP